MRIELVDALLQRPADEATRGRCEGSRARARLRSELASGLVASAAAPASSQPAGSRQDAFNRHAKLVFDNARCATVDTVIQA